MATGKRPIKDTKDPAVAWAEKLWERLHSSLLDSQKTIVEIIAARAWEPLGYESFSKAWVDKMSGIAIASELLPHVVYELLDEGLPAAEVASAVKGVGPGFVERLKEQKDSGVPVEKAAMTVVRRHRRKLPGQPSHLHIEVDSATLKRWQRIARQYGVTVQEVALPAIAAAFEELSDGAE